jgi:hypothetical protein
MGPFSIPKLVSNSRNILDVVFILPHKLTFPKHEKKFDITPSLCIDHKLEGIGTIEMMWVFSIFLGSSIAWLCYNHSR